MDKLPFKINFFRQVEVFQELKRLDIIFGAMLIDWEEDQEEGKPMGRNYPTWEIEKKILRWTTKYHKHLGSPIKELHFSGEKSEIFQKDSLISDEELKKIDNNVEFVLKSLSERGLARWDSEEAGAVINQDGLNWGRLISDIYQKNDESKLVPKKVKFWGYNLLYFTSLLIILFAISAVSVNIFNLLVDFNKFNARIGWLVIFMFPSITFLASVILIGVPFSKIWNFLKKCWSYLRTKPRE